MHRSQRILLLSLMLALLPQVGFADPRATPNSQPYTQPVLGLDLDTRILPLYRQMLMDPIRKGLIPAGAESLKRLEEGIAKDRVTLAEAKPERQSFLRSRLFDHLVQRALYWQSVVVGEKEQPSDLATTSRLLQETHQEILALGPLILKDVSNIKERAAILLQLVLVEAQYDDKRASALKVLGKIRGQFTNPKQVGLIEFLLALEAIETTQAGLRHNAIKQLEALSNRLDRRYSTLAYLAIARSLAGFASNGRPSWDISADYASYLRYVSRLCQTLSLTEKSNIFDFSLAVWTQQSNFDHQWDPVPFNVGCYEQARQFPAFLERLALAAANRKQHDRAMALYQHLNNKISRPEPKQQINLRMALLLRDEFKQGRRREEYQDFLISSQLSFRGTTHGIRLAQMHDELLQEELSKGLAPEAKMQIFASLRLLYQKYMDSSSENPDARIVRSRWAEVLALHGFAKEAVSILVSLAQGASGAVRGGYLRRAQSLQIHLLSWNPSNPWANPMNKDPAGMGQLKQIISMLRDLSTGSEQTMQDLNLAVIDRHLGLHENARHKLEAVLAKLDDRSLRLETFMALIVYAYEEKSYEDLENLCLNGKKDNLKLSRPIENFHSLNELYLIALEKQAESKLAGGQAESANEKLLTLIGELRPSERRNRVRYLLARSYQDLQKFSLASEQLAAIQKEGIRDEFFRQAILDRGALFLAQGDLPASIQSYNNFDQLFPSDPRNKAAQFVLIDGFLSQQKHREARKLILKLLLSKSLEDSETNSLALKLIRIHRSAVNSDWITEDLATLDRVLPDRPELRARMAGLSFREKQNGNLTLPASFPLKLREQSSSLFVISDLMSQIAFEKASKEAELGFNSVQHSLMATQDTIFDKIKESYTKARSSYAEACRVPYASHCGPALYETLFHAQRYSGLLQDLNIDQPNAEGTTSKIELGRFFAEENENLSKRLADAVQHGNTLPEWILKLSVANDSFWRYSAATAARQVNYLALPTDMASTSSFSFAKGSPE